MSSPKTPLTRFWMTLVYEWNKEMMKDDGHDDGVSHEDAFELAMNETEYEPIDTRFCMIKSADIGWQLIEASGTKIVRSIEAGDMGEKK